MAFRFNRYAANFEYPLNGPGDARPTAQRIVDDEDMRGKLVDKSVLITGASSGIGIETVRALATTGATLFLAVRDIPKAEAVVQEILESDSSLDKEKFIMIEMDLASLASVRDGAKRFLSKADRLNILINNAGIGACPPSKTKDGFEMQFGTNHLAHFLLFYLVEPLLLKSSTPNFQSRVIVVSSAVHRFDTVHIGDYNLTQMEYDPWRAYGQSKTANVWFSNEVERKYASKGLHSMSLHPGAIETGLQRSQEESGKLVQKLFENDLYFPKIFMSIPQGAATTVLAAVGRDFEGQGGFYMENCKVSPPVSDDGPMYREGYDEWIYDEVKEKQLWEDSLKFIEPWLS